MSVSRSKRKKKKKKKDRDMRPVRLEAVREIEKSKPSKSAAPAPPPVEEKRVDPATQKQIEELRRLGLSVSVNASPEKVRSLRQEFDVVTQYVQNAIQTLAPDGEASAKLSEQQLTRFIAMLFGNGQLVTSITLSQQVRSTLSTNEMLQKRTPEFKHVARLLRVQFPQLLPAKPWWTRLLSR